MKATGSPIKLGAIATNQPGTSFTDIPYMARAYFNCVNNNGGIKGHKIQLIVETEQTNPAQIAAEAKQLVQTDHVVGIVGNTSIIECDVDSAYWKSHGFFIIDSGIASECYGSSNSAAVNMGPRFSSDGAVQYAIAHGAKKIVFDQSNVPGTGYNVAGIVAICKHDHIPLVQLTENVPISDGDSVAIKEVEDAGSNGAVVLNFTPPEALVILQAAQKLGVREPREVVGLLDALQHGLPLHVTRVRLESQALRQRRACPAGRHQHQDHEAVQGDPEAVRLGGLGRRRQLQPDGIHRGRDRSPRSSDDQGRVHGPQCQSRIRVCEELQDAGCSARPGPMAITRVTFRTTATGPLPRTTGR